MQPTLSLPFAALLLASFTLVPQEPEPPEGKQLDALIEEYFELGPRADGSDRARQLEILEQLERVPPLTPKQEKKWRKELLELWMDGPELEKRGSNHLWEDEEKGFYIVGGKTKKPKGLVIGMHGGGVGSGDARPMASLMTGPASGEKWVGIFPEVLEKTERGWTDSGTEEFVMELVDRAIRTFDVDPNKVFLSGHSMGGYGSWTLGGHHADRVAGLGPSAGAPTPILSRQTNEIVDVDWGVIPNLKHVRMCVFQSTDDPRVPPDANQAAVAKVAEAKERWGGFEGFEYWEVDDSAHDPPPGGFGKLFERISDAERDPRPQDLVWQPVLSWKRQFYWLTWERPTTGAIVTAEIDSDANEVRITCDRPLAGASLLIDPERFDLDSEIVVRVNDAVVAEELAPEPSLATLVRTGVTGDPGRTYARALSW